MNIDMPGQVQQRIFDNNGRIVKQQQLNLQAGGNFLSLDLSSLPTGTYHLELKGKTINKKMQFVKL